MASTLSPASQASPRIQAAVVIAAVGCKFAALGTLTFQIFLKPMMGMGEPDKAKVDEAYAGIKRFGAVLDKRLEGRTWIVGDAMTIADLTIASSLMYAKQTDVPLGEHPNVAAWFGRITEMDAWKKSGA